MPTRDRERAKERLILLPTVDVRVANIHDPAQLEAMLQGVHAVINLVGVLHDSPKGAFQRTHINLPRNLVEHCQRLGIPRLLHMSALNASVSGPSRYLRSKGEGDRIVNEANEIATTIFRPSVVFGAGDHFLVLFAKLTRLMPVFPLAGADVRFQPIFVEDVARAMAESLGNPETFGQSYDLCGPKVYTLRELVRYAAKQVGADPLIVGLPEALARAQALVMEHLPGRVLTRDNLDSMKVDCICNGPFPPVFRFAPTPLEGVAPQYLGEVTSRARYGGFRARR